MRSAILGQGDMITVGPRCAHQLAEIEFSRVVEFSLEDVDYTGDTVAYEFR